MSDQEQNNQEQTQQVNQEASQEKEKSVPLAEFLKLKDELKVFKKEKEASEAQKAKDAEEKLLKEKNFEELLKKREQELLAAKSEKESLVKKSKLDGLRNKATNELFKVNAHDAQDVLGFMDFESVLDAENAEELLNKQIGALVEKKPYLFKGNEPKKRSASENGFPSASSGTEKKEQKPRNLHERTIMGLSHKFNN